MSKTSWIAFIDQRVIIVNKQYFKSCDSDSNISCDKKWKSQWPLLEDCMMYPFMLQLVKRSWLLCLTHCSSMQ